MQTVHDYTMEIIEAAMKAANVEPIYKHKIIKKIYQLKSYKDFKNRQLADKKTIRDRKPATKLVFHTVPKTVQKVMLLACEKNEIDLESFCSNRRTEDVVETQRMVIYFLHKEMRHSSTKVGRWFMKDHSTILHACKSHEDAFDTNKIYAMIYSRFKQEATDIISEV